MQVQVFFTPRAILPERSTEGDVFLVVDVIRATTTITVMLDQGAERVFIASSVEQARESRQFAPQRLLCGERNVKLIPGFDYGNSPRQFAELDLRGRELVLTTTNGTRAFHACPPTTTRIAACFYNAEAATTAALTLAQERQSNISIVCAGEWQHFALDDAVCAGYLVLALQRQVSRDLAQLQLHESALAASALYEAFKPPRVLFESESALTVLEAGLDADPPFCMQIDRSSTVPCVIGREEGSELLIIERLELPE